MRANSRKVDAHHPVLARGLLFRRRLEAVESMGNRNVVETRIHERRDKLRIQQSTGDSTGPQINVASRLLRELDAQHDIGDLYAPAGLQDAPNLGDRRALVSDEIEDAV